MEKETILFLKMDQYLDFEQPIYTRLEKIEELKKAVPPPKNLSKELNRLEVEAEKETKKIYKHCHHGKKS